jgi:hypothetical protein
MPAAIFTQFRPFLRATRGQLFCRLISLKIKSIFKDIDTVSATPQDFAIWSRLTGNPYPRTPEERMYLAPHVRQFVNNVGRQGGYIPVQQERGGLGKAISNIGKTALAAGLLTGAAMTAHHFLQSSGSPSTVTPFEGGGATGEQTVTSGLENAHKSASDILNDEPTAHPFHEQYRQPRIGGTVLTKLPLLAPARNPEAAESDVQVGTPFETSEQLLEGEDELIGHVPEHKVAAFRSSQRYGEEVPSQVEVASRDVTPPTLGQQMGEGIVPASIRLQQVTKGAPPGSPLKTLTEARRPAPAIDLPAAQAPVSQPGAMSLDEHLAHATIARERGDDATALKHVAAFQQRIKAGEPWQESAATHAAISSLRTNMPMSEQEYKANEQLVNQVPNVQTQPAPQAPQTAAQNFARSAALQLQEAQRSRRAPSVPAVGSSGEIEHFREHGMPPAVRYKGKQVFSPQDEEMRQLAHMHAFGYNPDPSYYL